MTDRWVVGGVGWTPGTADSETRAGQAASLNLRTRFRSDTRPKLIASRHFGINQ
jgi:hypothetical protein